jgi:hypothetical protein
MRAELQRNGDGSLEIVGISVRYGKPGSPITTHGDAFRFDDFFVKNMGYSKSNWKRFVRSFKSFCSASMNILIIITVSTRK